MAVASGEDKGGADLATLPMLGFPRILPPDAAIAAHVQGQIDQHARLAPAQQETISRHQRRLLLDHARRHSPFWAARLPALDLEAAPDSWLGVPILRRAELQAAGAALRAFDPARPGLDLSVAHTSGSTGQPVTVERLNAVYRPIYRAVAALEKRWHGIDPRLTRAVIRDRADGEHRQGGPGEVRERLVVRNIMQHSPEALLDWLRALAPRYLITLPSMAVRLARLAVADGGGPAISRIMTFGESVEPEHRRLCEAAFGARVVDRYSCEELGWIALQCPRHDHLHLLSSLVHMEIVDAQGRPCGIGEPGEVLLTGLQGYAAPLIRYAIGDVAEWGAPCDCGLQLPVIRRILGRRRNFLRMPDGSERLARLSGDRWHAFPKVQEFRLVQYGDDVIEAFLRCAAPLEEAERRQMAVFLQEMLTHPFDIRITETARIDWGGRQKREEFVRVDTPWPGRPAAPA
jgi:phenylacetate-CoA ligase